MRRLLAAPALLVGLTLALSACWPTNGTGAEKIDATIEVVHSAWPTATSSQIVTAVSIAIAESSLNPTARHYHPEYGPGFYDRGLWQISNKWYPGVSDASCDDPWGAARVMRLIAHDGTR